MKGISPSRFGPVGWRRRDRWRDIIRRYWPILSLFCSDACVGFIRLKEKILVRSMEKSEVTETQVDLTGDRVQLWSGGTGSGRPVLWLHGFGASAPWQWSKQVEHLAQRRQVFVPNLLWFGSSFCPHGNFSLDHQIEVVHRVLDSREVNDVDVVGISYGGLVAYGLSVLYPGLVNKLVMVDSPGPVFNRADLEEMHKRLGTKDLSEIFVPRDEKGVQKLLELAYFRPPYSPRWIRRAVLRGLVDPNRAEQTQLLSAMRIGGEPWRDQNADPRLESLVVWGADDTVFPLELGRRLATFLDAEIRIVDNARHVPNLEHDEQFNAIVDAFLK